MITLEKAREAAKAVEAEAAKLKQAVSVAVVDESGNVVLTHRMDNALVISPKFAYAKAYSSATLGLPTGDMAAYAVPGKPYFGINSLDERFTVMAGGLPVKASDRLVGGIGVGGSYDTAQDVTCAQAGLKVLLG